MKKLSTKQNERHIRVMKKRVRNTAIRKVKRQVTS